MSTYLSNSWNSLLSGSVRGLLLAGALAFSARSLRSAASAKGYRRKLAAPKKSNGAASSGLSGADEKLLADFALDTDEFVELLRNFIKHTEKLQNNPPDLIPQEDLIADQVIEFLAPYTSPRGPLEVRRVCYVEGRSNVIIKYNGDADKMLSFVGSHMDVVTANPAEFKRNPFELQVEGDTLYGRGVTDCLGHVAMLTCLFKQLALRQPKLSVGVAAVFIANEENSTIAGVGIDELAKQGELDFAAKGPLIWVDSANMGPTVGTAGVSTWEMKVTGYSGHSGVPQNAINAVSLGFAAIQYIQKRFYSDFPYTADAAKWLFSNGSSLKPTRVSMPDGGVTNIPREVTIKGDLRFLPFFTEHQVKSAVESYVRDLNEKVIRSGGLSNSGGFDRFIIPNPKRDAPANEAMLTGLVEWSWSPVTMTGVACDMDSVGYKALCDSVYDVCGEAKPFALTGSLPIIASLKEKGFDVQVTGFGRFDAYHAADEYAKISEFEQGARICATLIDYINMHL